MKIVATIIIMALLAGCSSKAEIQKIDLKKNMTLLTTQEAIKLLKGNTIYYDDNNDDDGGVVTYFDANGRFYNYYRKWKEADSGIWFVENNKLYMDVPVLKNYKSLVRIIKDDKGYIDYDERSPSRIVKIKKGDTFHTKTNFDWDESQYVYPKKQ